VHHGEQDPIVRGRAAHAWVPGVTRPDFTFELAAHLLNVDIPEQVPTVEEVIDGEWTARAECKGAPPGVFYPNTPGRDSTKVARQICAGCPVRAHCLVWAIQCDEQHGIWAGFDEDERRHLAGRFHARLIPVIKHGSEAGHTAHHRYGIPVCRQCADAHARYTQFTRPSRSGTR
jgi:WhiB family transcriptional regulator, redox-sensing transcriptional regulator